MNHLETHSKNAAAGSRRDPDSRATLDSLKKFSGRNAISFLILATVIAGFIWLDLREEYRATLASWDMQLSSAAEARVRVMALWRNERRRDIELIIRNPLTPRLLSGSGSIGESSAAQQGVEKELAAISQSFGYLAGAVLDSHCGVAAQVGMRPEMVQAVQDACQQVKPTGALRVDGFGMERGHVWVAYSVAVIARGEASPPAEVPPRKLGVVVMVADPWKDIDPLIAFESFPTRTSETLIVWKRDRDAFIYSPRLSAQGVESVFRRPLDGESFESRVARESDVAFGEFIDYRGVRVLGVARRIAAAGDSVARKVDRDEALSPYYRRVGLDGLVGALSLLLMGAVMVAQHRNAAARDSEARFKQQEALREGDRRYRVLFESAGEGIVLVRDGRSVDCNQKALELFGCGREHIIGTRPSALSPPRQPNGRNSLEEASENAKLALKGETLHFEWQHRRCDGTPFDAEVTLSPLEIGGEAHLLALIRDVTERKQAEEALRQSESSLKEALLAAQMGVWEWTPATDTVTWDENLYRIAGRDSKLPAPNLQEHPQIFTPESWERLKIAVENALATGTSYELDLEMIRPDGSKRWLIARGEALREAGRDITRLRGTVQDITERKRTEEALRESEERFRTTFENAGVGMALVDMQGYPIKSNPALQQMLGYSEEELSRLGVVAVTHPDDLELDWGLFRELAAGKRHKYEIEKRYLKKDGGVVWGLFTASLVKSPDRRPLYGIGMVQDITERKRAEEALRASEARFRTLITDAPVAIGVGRNGITQYVNTAYVRLFGLQNPEEAFGCPILDQHAPQCHEQVKDILRRRLQGLPAPNEYESVGRRKDGSTFPMQVAVSQVELADGPVSLGFLTDLTERKRAEEARRESEERYRRLFEVESDAIILVDVETRRILDANPTAVNLYGYTPEEFRLLAAEEVSAEPEKTQAAIAQEWTRTALRWHRKKDGTVFPVEISGNSFFNQGRQIHVAAIRDITERKRAEEALRESEERYRRLFEVECDAIHLVEVETGRILEVNAAAVKMYGYSREEFRSLTAGEVSAEPEKTMAAIAHEWTRAEFRWHRKKDGTVFPVEITGNSFVYQGRRIHVATIRDITERQRAEEALRQSEAGLKEALLAAQMGAWEWRVETDTVTWDDNLYRIAGRDPKMPAPRYQELPQIYTQASWERLKTAVENALATGTPYELDLEMVRPDGAKRWLISRGEPRRDASGQITRLRGTVQDITERKRAAEAWRESEERFRATFENAGVGMALVDMQGHLLKSNPALQQMLGYSDEEFSRMAFTEFTHPDDCELDWRLYSELAAGNSENYEIEKRYLKKGGGVVWGLLTVSLVKDKHGHPEYAVGMVQNITERKRAEEALWESDRRYKDFISHSHEGVWRVEMEQPIPIDLPEEEGVERLLKYGYVAECNLAFARNLGFLTTEELVGKSLCDIVPFADEERVDSYRLGIRNGWRSRTTELRGLDKEGNLKSFLRTEIPIVENGMLIRAWGITRDITELKRAEEELRLTRFSVEHASESIIWADSQSHILYANEAACRSLGRSLKELLRLTIPEVDPLFPKEAWGAHWENLKTRGTMTFETESVSKQGGVFPVEVTANYLEFDGKGYSFAFGRDITERKRAEDALRQSEQRYKDFIAHTHEGVWRLDLDQPIPIDLPALEILEKLWEYGYLAECNLAYARNIGFSSPEEIQGQRLRDLIPPSDPEKMEVYLSEARKGWVDRTVEFRSRDKSGHLKHFVRTEIPIVENGMLVRVWGITRDVSELKQAEQERQRSLDQLRALAARLQSIREEERKRVAREIHDQVGQALTAIKIDLSSLVQELPRGEKQQKKRASSVLKLLDESIQVVRRISTELRPGILDDLGLVATIEWVGEEFQSRTGTRCRLSLPRGDIAVDPERATAIFRILQETLTNVARHAEASEVEVRMLKEDGDLTLEVHDNGIGIPEGKLSANTSLGILGMRERAILLGGELTIESPAGNGTTVRVRIPVGPEGKTTPVAKATL